jgi:hypothetical protein
VNDPSRLKITLDFAAGLDPAGAPNLQLRPVDEDAELEGLNTVWGPTRHEITVDTAPSGDYRVLVSGARTVYELVVVVTPIPLAADRFEPNDSLETATAINMGWVDPDPFAFGAPIDAVPAGAFEGLTLGPGDVDCFAVYGVPPVVGDKSAWVYARGLDAPVTVQVLDASGDVLRTDVGYPSASAQLAITHPFSYVRVTSERRTRWNVWFVVMADLTDIPDLDLVSASQPWDLTARDIRHELEMYLGINIPQPP